MVREHGSESSKPPTDGRKAHKRAHRPGSPTGRRVERPFRKKPTDGRKEDEHPKAPTGQPTRRGAMGTLTEANRVFPEWSERDARLLKTLFGPRRESVPNTLFGPSELKDIDVRLQELKEQLKETQETLKLTNEQLKAMNTTLDETHEASKRIGRKDWLLLGIGALVTLAISAAFPPATVVSITKLFIHKVGHLFVEELAG